MKSGQKTSQSGSLFSVTRTAYRALRSRLANCVKPRGWTLLDVFPAECGWIDHCAPVPGGLLISEQSSASRTPSIAKRSWLIRPTDEAPHNSRNPPLVATSDAKGARVVRRSTETECRLIKRESPKQAADESPRRAATRRNIFRKANGWMLIKSIVNYDYYKHRACQTITRLCSASAASGTAPMSSMSR
jgi:hypothetical protein